MKRVQLFRGTYNLPGKSITLITLEEVNGIYIVSAFGGYDGIARYSFDEFEEAWAKVKELEL